MSEIERDDDPRPGNDAVRGDGDDEELIDDGHGNSIDSGPDELVRLAGQPAEICRGHGR